jgi:hypothetical protein
MSCTRGDAKAGYIPLAKALQEVCVKLKRLAFLNLGIKKSKGTASAPGQKPSSLVGVRGPGFSPLRILLPNATVFSSARVDAFPHDFFKAALF